MESVDEKKQNGSLDEEIENWYRKKILKEYGGESKVQEFLREYFKYHVEEIKGTYKENEEKFRMGTGYENLAKVYGVFKAAIRTVAMPLHFFVDALIMAEYMYENMREEIAQKPLTKNEKFKRLKFKLEEKEHIYEKDSAAYSLYSSIFEQYIPINLSLMSKILPEYRLKFLSAVEQVIVQSKDLETANEKIKEFYKKTIEDFIGKGIMIHKVIDMELCELYNRVDDSKKYPERDIVAKMIEKGIILRVRP